MFISYAQNFEDVMLWKAFKDIDAGFYVDVGAMDPVLDSVTKAFYDRGWRGINIEPVASYYLKIVQARPNDINIQVAVSNDAGEKPFFEIEDSGLSTLENNIADRYIQDGRKVQEYQVKTETLNSILDAHALGPIHFLKVDVEGHEKEVLEGLDLNKWRPWIIVIESTKPNTEDQTHIDWEEMLLNDDYHIVYFDGLNRYYISNGHDNLDKAFSSPPNIFDNFITFHHQNAINQLDEKQKNINYLEQQLDVYREQLIQTKTQLSSTQNRLITIQEAYLEEINKKEREVDSFKTQLTKRIRTISMQENEIESLEKNLSSTIKTSNKLQLQLIEVSSQADKYFSEYEKVLQSRSWHITKPFREIAWFFRRIKNKDTKGSIKQIGFNFIHWFRSLRITAPLRAVFGTARIWRDKLGQATLPKNHYDSKMDDSASSPNSSQKANLCQAPDVQEFNLDDIMEKIREEVARNTDQYSNLHDLSNGNIKETNSFRWIKKIQVFLRKFPLYTPINNIAIKFKRFIPKYRKHPLTVEDLLKYDGEKFIETAYKTILVREPDIDGFNNFLSLLQKDKLSKIQILGRLRFSKEGRRAKVKIKGLFLKFLKSAILRN